MFVLKLTGKQAFSRGRTDSFHITQGSKSGRNSTMTKKGSTLIQHPRWGGRGQHWRGNGLAERKEGGRDDPTVATV